jgi:hypothetical protein
VKNRYKPLIYNSFRLFLGQVGQVIRIKPLTCMCARVMRVIRMTCPTCITAIEIIDFFGLSGSQKILDILIREFLCGAWLGIFPHAQPPPTTAAKAGSIFDFEETLLLKSFGKGAD